MKTTLTALIAFLLGLAFCYVMWSFYWLSFDFMKWNNEGRITFLIFGNIFSIIFPIGVIAYKIIEKTE